MFACANMLKVNNVRWVLHFHMTVSIYPLTVVGLLKTRKSHLGDITVNIIDTI